MLEEGLLQQLTPLHYLVRHRVMGRIGGKQLSRRKGSSLDFAEHRSYLPGDDYRYIDWNLYGRLDRLFVRVFAREEDYPVYLLVDLSRSMGIGGKLARAAQLAAALGYVALKDQNRLGVYPFSRDLALGEAWPPRAGWRQIMPLFSYLKTLSLAEQTHLSHALTQFAHLSLHRGLAVLFSDMFCEHGYEEGLLALRGAGYAVIVLHLLAPADIDPQLPHEVWLTPAERGPAQRRLSGPESVRLYQRAVSRYTRQLQAFCHLHEIGYLTLPTSLGLEDVLLDKLRGRVLT